MAAPEEGKMSDFWQFVIGAPITLFVLYIFLSGISFSRRPSWRAQYKWSEQTPEVMAEYRAKRDAMIRRAEELNNERF